MDYPTLKPCIRDQDSFCTCRHANDDHPQAEHIILSWMTSITLTDCSITALALESLSHYLATPQCPIQQLTLQRITIQTKGCPAQLEQPPISTFIDSIAENTSLQKIHIQQLPIGNKFVYACCRAFRSQRLQKLHTLCLDQVGINDGGLVALCNVLTQGLAPTLYSLHLPNNAITEFGVQDLGKAIAKGIPVVDIDLSGNQLTLALTNLCKTLQTANATRFDFKFFRLAINHTLWSMTSIRALCDWLASPGCTLRALEIDYAYLNNPALEMISTVLVVNTSLRSLSLQGNAFDHTAIATCLHALRLNRHLQHLYLTHDQLTLPESEDLNFGIEGIILYNHTLQHLSWASYNHELAHTFNCKLAWNDQLYRTRCFEAIHLFTVYRIIFNARNYAINTSTSCRLVLLPMEILFHIAYAIVDYLTPNQVESILQLAMYRTFHDWSPSCTWPNTEQQAFLDAVDCTRACPTPLLAPVLDTFLQQHFPDLNDL
jgi:Ran GTPase-activating protein (RanGAP) involved in mRNA processing and transport